MVIIIDQKQGCMIVHLGLTRLTSAFQNYMIIYVNSIEDLEVIEGFITFLNQIILIHIDCT